MQLYKKLHKLGVEMNEKQSKIIKDRLDEVKKMGQRRYLEGLVNALKDDNYLIRLEAIEWLYRICDERTLGSMIEALNDNDSRIREFAIMTLIDMGGENIIEPLISALNDTNDRIREYATEALGEIGDKRALPALENLVIQGYNKRAREAIIKIKYGPQEWMH